MIPNRQGNFDPLYRGLFGSPGNMNSYNYNLLASANSYPTNPGGTNMNQDQIRNLVNMINHPEEQVPQDNPVQFYLRHILKGVTDTVAVIIGFRMILMTLSQWITEAANLNVKDSYIRRIFKFFLQLIGWNTQNQILHQSWTEVKLSKSPTRIEQAKQMLTKLNISGNLLKFIILAKKPAFLLLGLFLFFLLVKSFKHLRTMEGQKNDEQDHHTD